MMQGDFFFEALSAADDDDVPPHAHWWWVWYNEFGTPELAQCCGTPLDGEELIKCATCGVEALQTLGGKAEAEAFGAGALDLGYWRCFECHSKASS